MMDVSRRTRRMERHHKLSKQPAINLVSLMDIFTILVFFLLINSSNTQQLPSSKDLRLPTSIADKVTAENLVIAITKSQILVQGHKVADIETELKSKKALVSGLQKELIFQSQKTLLVDKQGQRLGNPVTIMGDENISYKLLRKILTTCRHANYTQIAFATLQKAKDN